MKTLFLSVFLSLSLCLTAQDVISLTLVNATTNTDIAAIEEGSTINLVEVGTSLNVRANVSGTVGSVKFQYDEANIGSRGNTTTHTESAEPYAMRGDLTGDYRVWTPSVGDHSITATAYSESSAGGNAGTPFTVNFTVVNKEAPPVEYELPSDLGTGAMTMTGELKKWHKITLSFDGPSYKESDQAPNPFLDYCLEVTFTQGTDTLIVPGYFATDGNAAETSAEEGNVWRVHFSPAKTGEWQWQASFVLGDKIAIAKDKSNGKSVTSIDGKSGKLSVAATDKTGRDLRAHGRLEYVGEHYLRFAETGKLFVKAGADAPENLLAYEDFDGAFSSDGISDDLVKSWSAHAKDWKTGDPSWKNGKGTELIGAINYLASEGLNVFSFLTMNIGGDDKNVYPYVSHTDFKHFDCSKMDQWGMVFDHGMQKGMYLHFKTQETENETLLDGGNLGVNRKLYYRELIARYGYHLAMNWNLGEENSDQSDAQRKAMAEYFSTKDPYKNHIVIHSYPYQHDKIYPPLLGNKSLLTGISVQTPWNNVHAATAKWVKASRDAGRKWVVANDEQGSAQTGVPHDAYTGTPNLHDIRKETLWGNFMAGGAGVEYYFGYKLPHSDLDCEDFRSRDKSWDYMRYALEFFNAYDLPLHQMSSQDQLLDRGWCLASEGQVYLVYLKDGGTAKLSMSQDATYTVKWYDTRNGGELKDGSVTQISGTGAKSLGSAPDHASEDWLILVTRSSGIKLRPTIVASADKTKGIDSLTVNFDASKSYDEDGSIVSYDWNFDDGQSAQGAMVSHTFNNYGQYEVLLTITDNDGASSTQIISIDISSSTVVSDCGKPVTMLSKDFPLGTYYLDDYTGQDILAIKPGSGPVSASTEMPFPGENCTYDLIFHGVGENDGQSSFKIFVNGKEVGAYTIPLSTEGYEYADKYNLKVKDLEIKNGDIIKVEGTTGSADGKEWSRARWLKLEYIPVSYLAGDCEGAQFSEQDGIVVMEVESVPTVNGWVKKTSPAGFHGNAFYMWDGSDNFNTPGAGVLEYKFKINNPGTYHFRWHCKIMHGTDKTESNDTWMKIEGADDFFGKKGTSVKYPKGGMFVQSQRVFDGASKNGWMKVYSSGTVDWTWSSRTNDNEAHEIYATFNKPGVFTLKVSGRSRYHAIDRIVLFQDSKFTVSQATAASQKQTLCGEAPAGLEFAHREKESSLKLYPSPVAHVLTLASDKAFENFQIINLQGNIMMQGKGLQSSEKSIDVSRLPAGLYLVITQGDDTFSQASFIKH